MAALPETGFLRLPQILGDKKAGVPPLVPVSATCWWTGIREGRFPSPVKLSPNVSAWRVSDIRALIDAPSADQAQRQRGRKPRAAR